jgi:hypothetical protein
MLSIPRILTMAAIIFISSGCAGEQVRSVLNRDSLAVTSTQSAPAMSLLSTRDSKSLSVGNSYVQLDLSKRSERFPIGSIVSIKQSGVGPLLSVRGTGFETAYGIEFVHRVMTVVQGHASILSVPQSSLRAPIEPELILWCPNGRPACGGAGTSTSDAWMDPYAPDSSGGCAYNQACGDDGQGTTIGTSILVFPGTGTQCSFNYVLQTPSCFYHFPEWKPHQAIDLFVAWTHNSAFVKLDCAPTSNNGATYATYFDPAQKGVGFAKKAYTAGVLTQWVFPHDWYTDAYPSPPGTTVSISSNFYTFGIPVRAFYDGWCDHSG